MKSGTVLGQRQEAGDSRADEERSISRELEGRRKDKNQEDRQHRATGERGSGSQEAEVALAGGSEVAASGKGVDEG